MVRPKALLHGELTVSDLKPFYEAIVDAIQHCWMTSELTILAELIQKTRISENHEAIVEAWESKISELQLDTKFPSIRESVMAQKPERSKLFLQLQEVLEGELLRDADDIASEAFAMSDDEVVAALEKEGLSHLVNHERIEAILAEAMGNPKKATKLILIWDRDKDKSKTED